jgi:maltose alpha-D-glucosyltransferase/alpha-amylase
VTPPDDTGVTTSTTEENEAVLEAVRGDFSEATPSPSAGVDVTEEVHEVEATTESQGTPEWFKTAVFYEVLVRSFRDADGDGTGDFRGLTEKLDYPPWPAIDSLWAPPSFTSTPSSTRPTIGASG